MSFFGHDSIREEEVAKLVRSEGRTFERLGYSYKARRRKAAVAEKHRPARLACCDWVEKQDQEDLNDWSYVDGTSIYLATHEAQHLDRQRGSLGRSVWRLTDGSDSLEDKNVGESSYAKSQGKPVKIWGLLADGHLEYCRQKHIWARSGAKAMTIIVCKGHTMCTTQLC